MSITPTAALLDPPELDIDPFSDETLADPFRSTRPRCRPRQSLVVRQWREVFEKHAVRIAERVRDEREVDGVADVAEALSSASFRRCRASTSRPSG